MNVVSLSMNNRQTLVTSINISILKYHFEAENNIKIMSWLC